MAWGRCVLTLFAVVPRSTWAKIGGIRCKEGGQEIWEYGGYGVGAKWTATARRWMDKRIKQASILSQLFPWRLVS
ncbi:hypothetical protein J3E68DRAFT_416435 [Trichoderma sp. SZMC 28012]